LTCNFDLLPAASFQAKVISDSQRKVLSVLEVAMGSRREANRFEDKKTLSLFPTWTWSVMLYHDSPEVEIDEQVGRQPLRSALGISTLKGLPKGP